MREEREADSKISVLSFAHRTVKKVVGVVALGHVLNAKRIIKSTYDQCFMSAAPHATNWVQQAYGRLFGEQPSLLTLAMLLALVGSRNTYRLSEGTLLH